MERVKKYVVNLLQGYNGMKNEIQALEFETKNIQLISPDEMIEAMQFPSSTGERVSGGSLSDRTPTIALNYMEKYLQMRAQATTEISLRITYLKGIVRRLEHSIDMLEPHQASIIREYYFDNYSWRELQDLKGVSFKTLIKYRNDGISALVRRYEMLAELGVLGDLDSDYNTSTSKLQ